MVMVGVLSMTIGRVLSPAEPAGGIRLPPVAEEALAAGILTPQHVARLGGELFGRHLIAGRSGRACCCWSAAGRARP